MIHSTFGPQSIGYYSVRGCAFILMYSVTSRSSFEAVADLNQRIAPSDTEDIPPLFVIVANKEDAVPREVETEGIQGRELHFVSDELTT